MLFSRVTLVLWMVSSCLMTVNGDYKNRRKGEKKDPAGVDTSDTSIIMVDGEEPAKEEKTIAKKLEQLGNRRSNNASLKKENEIQNEEILRQREMEEEKHLLEGTDRQKRYMYDYKPSLWTKAIVPYKVNETGMDAHHRNEISRVMKLYEDKTCFRFYEWDNNTQSKYGLDHNNYLHFVRKTGCWAVLGNTRQKTGGQGISCCGGMACVHEIGHAIGFYHEQNSPYAVNYLRPNPQNINDKGRGSYEIYTWKKYDRDLPYDLSTTMHYSLTGYSNGKGPSLTLFNPNLNYMVQKSNYEQFYFFKEMTIVYQCKEMKCPDFKMKCENDGYVAYIKGKCQCKCVKGLDPATGCTTLLHENKLDKTLPWPSSKFSFLRPANTKCPTNSKEGSLTHKSDGGFTSDVYQAMGDHENLHFCTFDQDDDSGHAHLWPHGEYCLTRAGGYCPKKGCPLGWTLNEQNRHCYKLFKTKVKGFIPGSVLCKKHKGYIAQIDDQAEQEFLTKTIKAYSYIGVNDIEKENAFVGTDGKELKYTNWRIKGKPDNRPGDDCVLMRLDGTWNVIECWYRFPVVCEMSIPEFEEGYIEFEDDTVTNTGTLPDVVSGGKTKLEFCCRNDGNIASAVIMPTSTKFSLWQVKREGCQRVKDTVAISNHFAYRMKQGKTVLKHGSTPLSFIENSLAYAYFCVYQPISKECGKMIELTDENPSYDVTSPYYPHPYHANMECTWLIKSKPKSRIVVTFETFEIPKSSGKCVETLEVRFSLPGQPGQKFCGHEIKTSIYSSENYINLILTSISFDTGKKFKAKVTMIKDEDLCYYGADKGSSYRGTVNFSRNFKACLPWNNVTHCIHYQQNPHDARNGLEGDYCRNPHSGNHPWCYTESKNCVRDYCDVCGFGRCHDVYPDCANLVKKNPNYCKDTASWKGIAGCAKTCGFCERQTKKKYAELSCKNAPVPKNAVLQDSDPATGQVGKTVRYHFSPNKHNVFDLTCLSDGSWTKPYVCPNGWKLDSHSKKCNKFIMQSFSGRYAGEQFCRKYGGHLAVITNNAENAFVTKLLKHKYVNALIDLNDKMKENKFVWSTGETSTYRKWKEGEPNNSGNEDCTWTNGHWSDISCTTDFKAILCQIPLPVSYCKDGTTNCEKFRKLKNVAVGKPSKQSSTYYINGAKYAVDGKKSKSDMYTHTSHDEHPWWEVDLQSVYKIKKLLIVNRNGWGARLHKLKITIGEVIEDMKECTFYEGPSRNYEFLELECTSPMFGRFVKLEIMEKGYLQVAEVEIYAYTDVPAITCPKPPLPDKTQLIGSLPASLTMGAVVKYSFGVNKNIIASTTCLSSGSWSKQKECPDGWVLNAATKKCNKVIKQTFRGRYAGDVICRKYSGYVATITDQAENDFIQKLVDDVDTRSLIDKSDRLKEKKWVWSNGLTSSYDNWDSGEPNDSGNQDCAAMLTSGKWWDLACQDTFHAVVCQISLPVGHCADGTTNCEQFKSLKNVAVGKSATQSSTYSTNTANYAIDGKKSKSDKYTHTNSDEHPWLKIDLQAVYKIKKLLIVNRDGWGDRLKNLKVTVGVFNDDMKQCIFYDGPAKNYEYVELECTLPIFGRYVKLEIMAKGYLQVLEVEVYAYTDVQAVTCPNPPLPDKAKIIGSSAKPFAMGTVVKYNFDVNKENIFSIACLNTGSWTKDKECPEGWSFNAATKKCNKVIKQTFRGRYEGDVICRKYSGYVATITDQAENGFIQKLVDDADTRSLIDKSDRMKENTWVWSNAETSSYVNWDSGEPNDSGNQDCAAMITSGKWWDLACQDTFHAVVCQITLPVGYCADGTTKCEQFKSLKNVAVGKTATQSSTYWKHDAKYAIDGKKSKSDTYTHTNHDEHPWLEIDLQAVYKIKKLLIVNRNGWGYRLKNLKVTIGVIKEEMKQCIYYEGPAKNYEFVELECESPIFGKYIKLEIMEKGYLQVSEVEVYAYSDVQALTCPDPPLPNEAKIIGSQTKPFAMGTVVKYNFDVNKNNIFSVACLNTGSWTKVKECPEGGWSFNAATKKCNKVIKQTFRGRYQGDVICRKYSGYVATITDKAENDFIQKLVNGADTRSLIDKSDKLKEKQWVWSNGETSPYDNWDSGEPNDYGNQDCAAMLTSGKWWDLPCQDTFHAVVCQISVPVGYCADGTTNCEQFKSLKNVAVGKSATQSSTYYINGAKYAIDGKKTRSDTYTHTNRDEHPWLEIDLQSVYKIKKLLIVNRNGWGDRLSNLKVTVGLIKDDMKQCIFYDGPAKNYEYVELECTSPIFGRYVKLEIMAKGYLQVLEVEVYAYTDVQAVTCPNPPLPDKAKIIGSPAKPFAMGTVVKYNFDVNKDNIFSIACLSTGSWTKIKECPEGWTFDAATKKCNKVMKQTFRGRYAGDVICRKYSGYVATITGQAENDFIQKLVYGADIRSLVGISDRLKEKKWVYSNGDTSSYVNWDSGEPNDSGNQDCAAMLTSGKWWDLACQDTFHAVVCQISVPVDDCGKHSVCAQLKSLKNVAVGKPAKQSSTYNINGAKYAVDGKKSISDTYTHTNRDEYPWWEVDLQSVYKIKKLLIVNRNGWGDRLNNLKVTIGELHEDKKECIFYEGPAKNFEHIELECMSSMFGRFVKLELQVAGYLQLIEVEVLADTSVPEITCPGKALPDKTSLVGSPSASQKMGTVVKYKYDKNKNNVFSKTCLSTGKWSKESDCPVGWVLDTASKCDKIIKQTFTGKFNGAEICRKYNGFLATIKTKAENDILHKLSKSVGSNALVGLDDRSKEGTYVWTDGEKATYFNWMPNEPNNWANMQDCVSLHTYGQWYDINCQDTFHAVACQIALPVNTMDSNKLKNAALGKAAKQSTTWQASGAELAVDGKIGECSHTQHEQQPWWQVDLGAVFQVKKILIVNRMERLGNRLKNLKVTVGETEDDMKEFIFYEGPGSSNEYIELNRKVPVTGRFVKVLMTTGGYLQLTEVKVYTKE